MSIDKIRNIGLDKLVTQVYDFDSLTTDELLCKFAQKINIIIEHLKYVDDRCYNSDKAMELKLDYLLNQGLEEQVAKRLLNLINDGTLEELINQTLFNQINEEIPRVFDYNNKFITDYKGICVRTYNSNTLNTNRYRSDFIKIVNECGINSVALTINTYQPSLEDNNPFTRQPVSLEEIEDYIKFLKQNNLRIMFKHHVEIDTSEYKWRASINPSVSNTWFENYKNGLIEYAKLCEKYKVEAFSVGSEYRILTKTYPEKWIEVINEVRKVYKGLLTYGANLNNDERDEVHEIKFWNYLDFIGLDFYIYPIEAGTVDDYKKAFYHTSNHKNVHVMLDSISNKFNKPIVFCEYGKSDNTTNRNNYLQAINESIFTKEYVKGGFIWVYDPDVTDWFETNPSTINLINSNNVIKGVTKNNDFYSTMKNSGETRFSKFLEYKVDTTYKDAYIEFDFYIKGITSVTTQRYSKVRIKISTNNTLVPNVFFEVDGNMSESDFVYTITDNLIEFYVKVPQYYSVIYSPYSSEIGLFNILEYQSLVSITGTNATNKINEQTSVALTIANIGNIKVATGVITDSMASGIIDKTINIPGLNQVFGISVNVDYISGGNSYDVVCYGKYNGNNTIKFSGKHLSVQGGYSYELSYIVYYK